MRGIIVVDMFARKPLHEFIIRNIVGYLRAHPAPLIVSFLSWIALGDYTG